MTIWLDTDPCPACGTALHVSDTGSAAISQDCPACGWTSITDMATGGAT